MSATEVIEQIRRLPPEEYRRVLAEVEEDLLDLRIERDVLAGKFDAAWEEAKRDLDEGRCRPLEDLLNEEGEG